MKKQLLILFFLPLLSHAADFTLIQEDAVKDINRKLIQLSLPASKAVAPLVPCEFGQGGMQECFLDTGSSNDSYVLDTPSNRQAFTLGKKYKRTGMAMTSIDCWKIEVKNAQVAEAMVYDLKGYSTSLCAEGDPWQLLGLPPMEGKVWNLFFKSNVFEEESGSSIKTNPIAIERQNRLSSHLRIPLEVGKVKTKVIYDTGARATLVDLAFVVANPQLFEYLFIQKIQDTTGAFLYAGIYRVKQDFKVGGVNLGKDYVAAIDFRPAIRHVFGEDTTMILGMNHIINADWVLDLKNDLMYLSN